jgi:hypothetical protein
MEVNGLVLTRFTGNGYENMWGAQEGLLIDGDILFKARSSKWSPHA